MKFKGNGKLVRIFIGESDKCGNRPLYEAIVRLARQEGLAGATVFRGIEGYGANSRVHTTKILRLSEDLPVMIEIADQEEKIRQLLPYLDDMVTEGLITLENIEIIKYTHNGDSETC
jgi:PII-like signaling protein